jgi:hypothetical protein
MDFSSMQDLYSGLARGDTIGSGFKTSSTTGCAAAAIPNDSCGHHIYRESSVRFSRIRLLKTCGRKGAGCSYTERRLAQFPINCGQL